MSTEKNIILQQFNGVDYDILYPKTLAEQISVNSSIANLFGLSENEANISNIINNIYYSINGTDSKLYQWNRWKYEFKTSDFITRSEINLEYYRNIHYMNQFDSITFDRNGKAIGVGKTVIYSQHERPYLTMGKFYSNNVMYESELTSKGPWFYMCPGASVHEDRTNDEIDLRDVAVISDNTIKTSEIVTSTNPNAYTISDSPDAEGWYYEKLPDIQMYPPLGRFISSSYTGTGTYGSSNRNTIILPFNPKMVIISQNDSLYLGILVNSSSTGTIILSGSSDTTSKATVTWGDKQVSWYGPSITSQLNTNGKTYNYIALGNL